MHHSAQLYNFRLIIYFVSKSFIEIHFFLNSLLIDFLIVCLSVESIFLDFLNNFFVSKVPFLYFTFLNNLLLLVSTVFFSSYFIKLLVSTVYFRFILDFSISCSSVESFLFYICLSVELLSHFF